MGKHEKLNTKTMKRINMRISTNLLQTVFDSKGQNSQAHFVNGLTLLLLTLFFVACTRSELPQPSIIPQPSILKEKPSFFAITKSTRISCKTMLNQEADYLIDFLNDQTGLKLKKTRSKKQRNYIRLELSDKVKQDEGYRLIINGSHILIRARTNAGIFYGIQSLLQLVPARESQRVVVPAIEISDAPRFAYRGLHLDVARHFFEVSFIKKMLDAMAFYKLNRFHWHLTDDQGWRIEIENLPLLTQTGAWRANTLMGHADDRPEQFDTLSYGGFYTRDEIREVIDYAVRRHITIIPEIEMPGHAQAALAAYPYLGCFDSPLAVWNKWGISENVFCAGKETTFEFIETVLSEVCDLFPGEYIHIGGDECVKTHWKTCPSCQARIKAEHLNNEAELQSYFIQRVEKILSAKGKKMIGWDEILEGGLAESATVMSWQGETGGIAAARLQHDVLMSPNSVCYFDYYQADSQKEPLAFGGLTTLETVYHYNPVPSILRPDEQAHILGIQACVRTEYIPFAQQAEYMIFPRLCALSEVGWSLPEKKDFSGFMHRLRQHESKLKSLGVNYRKFD